MLDFDAIRTLVTQYFEGPYDGDVAMLARIFHPRSPPPAAAGRLA